MSADAAAARFDDDSAGDVGALYEEHVRMLVGIATKRYRIAESDAEGLAHDVFGSYLMRSGEIHDSRAWLFGAICNASKFFLRMKARHVPLSPAIAEEPPGGTRPGNFR